VFPPADRSCVPAGEHDSCA